MPRSQDARHPQQLLLALMHTYARGASAMVWSGGLVELMAELGFSRPATRMALSRLVRSGAMRRAKQGRLAHCLLSDQTRRLLDLQRRRVAMLGSERDAVQTWTIAWHERSADAREERARLSALLLPLGFAALRPGAWIAADDRRAELIAVLAEARLGGSLSAIAGPAASRLLAPERGLACAAGDLERRYGAFCAAHEPLAGLPEEALTDAEAFAERVLVERELATIAAADPGLPLAAAAGQPASRARAIQIAEAVAAALRPAAQRHFDDVTTAWMRNAPRPPSRPTAHISMK